MIRAKQKLWRGNNIRGIDHELRSYFFFFLFWLTCGSILGQAKAFDIFIGDQRVGNLKVSKTTYINGGMVIDLATEFDVEMVGTSTIEMYATSFFKRNLLTASECIMERNGRIREQCAVEYAKGKYRIERKNEKQMILEGQITFTLHLMYLVEPKGINQVFAERYGDMCTLQQIKEGVYEVKLPAGNAVRYYYQKGVCIKTENIGNLQNMTMKLKI